MCEYNATVAESMAIATDAIRESTALLIVAGAGMGVDSGLPDFRGEGGFYRNYLPYCEAGLSPAMTGRAGLFEEDPRLAWGIYAHRMQIYNECVPHGGFTILKQIAEKKKQWFVLTSNIDGHFQRAGFLKDRIHECHGNCFAWQCMRPCCHEVWKECQKIPFDPATLRAIGPLPVCIKCAALARPHVFLFGDTRYAWKASEQQAMRLRNWLGDVWRGRLAILEIGCGKIAPGLRRHNEEWCRESPNAFLIRINLNESDVPNERAVSIPLRAREALTIIGKRVL